MDPSNIQDRIDRIHELPIEDQRDILATLDLLDSVRTRSAASTKFIPFVKKVWPGFVEGYHHQIMADAFERVVAGTLKRVIINMAPRHTKSEFASHMFPAFFFGSGRPRTRESISLSVLAAP